MFQLFMWLTYGLVTGIISKSLHPGEDPVGLLPTIGIGIAGSFVGGFLNWILGNSLSPIGPSGLLMGIVGSVIFLAAYRYFRLKFVVEEPRSFWTGKKI
jgi:uncharacterized membrane protein YeaQ/YmgE (transglycosylase-associated protein family)